MKRGVAFLITLLALIPSVLAAPRFERTLQTLGDTGNFVLRLLGNKPLMIIFLLVVIWWGVSELLKIILKQSLGEKYQESYSKLIIVVVGGICLLLFGVAAGSPTGTINAILSIGFNATFFLLLLIVTVFAASLYSWLKSVMGLPENSKHNTGVVAASFTIAAFAWSTVLGWMYAGLLANFNEFRRVSNNSAAEAIIEFSELVWIFALLAFILGFFFFLINRFTGKGEAIVEKFSETEFKEDVLKEKSAYAHAKSGLKSIGQVFGDATEVVFGSGKKKSKKDDKPKDPFESKEIKGLLGTFTDLFIKNNDHIKHLRALSEIPMTEENPFLNIQFLEKIGKGRLLNYKEESSPVEGDITLNSPQVEIPGKKGLTFDLPRYLAELNKHLNQLETKKLKLEQDYDDAKVAGVKVVKGREITAPDYRLMQIAEKQLRAINQEISNTRQHLEERRAIEYKLDELLAFVDRHHVNFKSNISIISGAKKFQTKLNKTIKLQEQLSLGTTPRKINKKLNSILKDKIKSGKKPAEVAKDFLDEIKSKVSEYRDFIDDDNNDVAKLSKAYFRLIEAAELLSKGLLRYYEYFRGFDNKGDAFSIKHRLTDGKEDKIPAYLVQLPKMVHALEQEVRKTLWDDDEYLEVLDEGLEMFEEEIKKFEKEHKLNEKKK